MLPKESCRRILDEGMGSNTPDYFALRETSEQQSESFACYTIFIGNTFPILSLWRRDRTGSFVHYSMIREYPRAGGALIVARYHEAMPGIVALLRRVCIYSHFEPTGSAKTLIALLRMLRDLPYPVLVFTSSFVPLLYPVTEIGRAHV